MTMPQDASELEWDTRSQESPFAEAQPQAEGGAATIGFAPWNEMMTPFSEADIGPASEAEADRLIAEAFDEVRDESFDEAVAYLAEETEQAVGDRFTSEAPALGAERERYADAQLSPVRFEAEQYLEALEQGLAGMDIGSLSEQQLDETIDRFDPATRELTPAGEEFIGALVRKAKKVVKFVARTAGNVAGAVGKVAGAVLGPILKKLRGLINPLLKRVLSFAIGRLPAPLRPAARMLAKRITSEANEEETFGEGPMSPTNLTDVETVSEEFDAALAEAMTGGADEFEGDAREDESFDTETDAGGRELEVLSEARGELIDRFKTAGDGEDLSPAVEQFVPALLGVLRIGINLVGRPKVVGFLAKYLGQLIKRWVGPQLATPLSNAIVDTGLRLLTLEAESNEASERTGEVGPIALASVVEDTVRRLAENEDYVFENEDLMQLAASEAFSQAVATHFPPRFVRPGLQQAPSLGGTFVARRARSLRPYRKYSRVPEVDITPQIADALPTFGGATVGSVLRAAGATFPIRARMHIYQSAAGTTLPRMVRVDRGAGAGGRGYFTPGSVHPLTPGAAGLLLREPQFGVPAPARYLRSRNRIAIGQRFYVLEPIGAVGSLALPPTVAARSATARLAPSRAWTVVNLRRGRITVGFYLSEAEAQGLVEVIRQGRGAPALLQTLSRAFKAIDQQGTRIVNEDREDFDGFSASPSQFLSGNLGGLLRRQVKRWVLPALASWARNNAEAFARAAAHPDAGVTIRVHLNGVPGLDMLRQAATAVQGGGLSGLLNAMRGKPSIQVTVTPGRNRK